MGAVRTASKPPMWRSADRNLFTAHSGGSYPGQRPTLGHVHGTHPHGTIVPYDARNAPSPAQGKGALLCGWGVYAFAFATMAATRLPGMMSNARCSTPPKLLSCATLSMAPCSVALPKLLMM